MDIQRLGQQGYDAYLSILDAQATIGKYPMEAPEAVELARAKLTYGIDSEEMIGLYNAVLDAAREGTRKLPTNTDAAKIATGLASILHESGTIKDYLDSLES